MYNELIDGITKRVTDLTKFADESYANHHQVRGRLSEAQEIRNWLIASKVADDKAAAEAKTAKGKKDTKGKKKVDETKAPSNVTSLPKKAIKPKAIPANG